MDLGIFFIFEPAGIFVNRKLKQQIKQTMEMCPTITMSARSDTDIREEKEEIGPFSKFASKKLLQKLEEFESSVVKTPISPKAMVPELRVTWDDVEIDGVLGEGSFSFIFKVWHICLDLGGQFRMYLTLKYFSLMLNFLGSTVRSCWIISEICAKMS